MGVVIFFSIFYRLSLHTKLKFVLYPCSFLKRMQGACVWPLALYYIRMLMSKSCPVFKIWEKTKNVWKTSGQFRVTTTISVDSFLFPVRDTTYKPYGEVIIKKLETCMIDLPIHNTQY